MTPTHASTTVAVRLVAAPHDRGALIEAVHELALHPDVRSVRLSARPAGVEVVALRSSLDYLLHLVARRHPSLERVEP